MDIFSKRTKKSNPTQKTQDKILEVLRKTPETEMQTITSLAEKTNLSTNQVRASVEWLESLGIIQLIVSSGGTTLVKIRRGDNAGEKTNHS